MRVFNIIASLGFLLTSCASEVLYYGKSYPVTNHIDIYFQQSDIKEPYEIIGKGIYEDFTISSSDKIQDKIIAAMKRKGVDGIIFEDIYLASDNSSTNKTETHPSHTASQIQVIKTTLVKYKKNLPH